MELKRVLICVALMALVTYIPRVLPVTVFRKSDPVAVYPLFSGLYALCRSGSPDVSGRLFYSTGHLFSAAGGTAVAIVLGYKGEKPGGSGRSRHCGSLYFRAAGRSRPVEVERKTAQGGIQKQDIRQNTKAEMRKRQ